MSLSLMWACSVTAVASEPGALLIEYQAYRPSPDFGLNDGPDSAMFTAIQTEPAWKALWSDIEPRMARDMNQRGPHPLPPIDFTRKTLLVAALGAKPTGGYSISIHSVIEGRSGITVNAIAVRPAKNCILTMATTHPIALILIPRTSKPIRFSTAQAEHKCE
jgi:hypothetical protein